MRSGGVITASTRTLVELGVEVALVLASRVDTMLIGDDCVRVRRRLQEKRQSRC